MYASKNQLYHDSIWFCNLQYSRSLECRPLTWADMAVAVLSVLRVAWAWFSIELGTRLGTVTPELFPSPTAGFGAVSGR